jgi:outer membrane immunogenic protein
MREQIGVVAAPSHCQEIWPSNLAAKPPTSNQIQAMLFDEKSQRPSRGTKMKKFLLGTVAAVAFAAPAFAADLPARTYTKAPVYTPPQVVYNWTGFYIGGHVGGGFAGDNSLQGSDARFLGGVQGGFDYQFAPNWVMGVEAQYSWLGGGSNSGVTFPGGTLVTANTDQLGSVTGRLGYTWGPALLYAKGGYAWRDNNNIAVSFAGVPQPFTTDGSHRDGYTVGAGLEYMFAPSWSAKVEYQYYNFGNTTFTSGPADIVGTRFRDDDHTVKAGLNYRFGWGGPIATRY